MDHPQNLDGWFGSSKYYEVWSGVVEENVSVGQIAAPMAD